MVAKVAERVQRVGSGVVVGDGNEELAAEHNILNECKGFSAKKHKLLDQLNWTRVNTWLVWTSKQSESQILGLVLLTL